MKLNWQDYDTISFVCKASCVFSLLPLILMVFAPNKSIFYIFFGAWLFLFGLQIYSDIKSDKLYKKVQYNKQAISIQ